MVMIAGYTRKPGFGEGTARQRLGIQALGRAALAILFFVVQVLSQGCSSPSSPPLPPPALSADRDQPSHGLTQEQLKLLETETGDYRLGAGDQIQVYAMDVAEINRKYVIGPDGKITLPGIGVVSLDGLTREQAAERIESLLKPIYLNPKISIIVEEYNNNRIFVLGEVRKPGQYNFPGRPLLLSALARAEGLTDKADMRGCTVLRGKGTVIEIDLYELLRKGDRTLNLPLLPEDTVYVKADEEHTFYVLGEVNHPGVFPRGQEVDVIRAIALAGGETHDAQLKAVRVVRREKEGPPKMFEVNVTGMLEGQAEYIPSIESGDVVYVPRRGIATFNYYVTQLTPSMNTILLGATLVSVTKPSSK
jgi:polysaccharide biosynthesis/export protein